MSSLQRPCALLFCLLVAGSIATFAQDAPRVEIYTDYSFGHSHSRLGTRPSPTLGPCPPNCAVPVFVDNQPRGFEAGANFFFNSWFGLSAAGAANLGDNGRTATAMFGPIFKIRTHRAQPFFMARAGIHHVRPADDVEAAGLDSDTGVGLDLGGGLDVRLNHRVDLRLIQADYIYGHHTYPLSLASKEWMGYRLGAGLVFKFGQIGAPPAPPSAACSAQPSSVFAGEPITVTANSSGFPANRTLTYSWTASGGAKVSGNAQSTQVDTGGLAPGSYTVTANITSNKKHEVASCNASFTVKERPKNPPSITCSVSAQSVQAGQPLSFSANASSPDAGVKIAKVDWSVSAGTIASGQGTSQISVDTGGGSGSITATAQATDDRGLTNSCSATANVVAPPKKVTPPPEITLRSVYFATAIPNEKHPDRGLIASQQQTLTSIANSFKQYMAAVQDANRQGGNFPEPKLYLQGFADPRGGDEYNQKLSERRVNIVQRFLEAQGIPSGVFVTQAFGKSKQLNPDEVKAELDRNPELNNLTPNERKRILRNMHVIQLASNRRVDIGLNAPDQDTVREYPFRAADWLTLIGGREKPPAKKPGTTTKKPGAKKSTKSGATKKGTKK